MKISSLSYAAVAILLSCIPSTLVAAQESSVRGGSSGLPVAERMMEEAPVLLAEVDLGNNVKASFYKSVGDSIVLSTITPQEGEHHERLLRLLKEVGQDEEDPITLYGRLKGFASGAEDGSDTSPPSELAAAWETVQSRRAEKQSAAAAAESMDATGPELSETLTHAENTDAVLGPQDGRHLASASQWWITYYCSDYYLNPYDCRCYHYLTDDFRRYTYADEIYFHVAVAGRVGQQVVGIENGYSYSLFYQTVETGEVGTIQLWAAYDQFGAYIKYASGDVYHVSLYEVSTSWGYNTCTYGW